MLYDRGMIDSGTKNTLEKIRRTRNKVVHAAGPQDFSQLREATQTLMAITAILKKV